MRRSRICWLEVHEPCDRFETSEHERIRTYAHVICPIRCSLYAGAVYSLVIVIRSLGNTVSSANKRVGRPVRIVICVFSLSPLESSKHTAEEPEDNESRYPRRILRCIFKIDQTNYDEVDTTSRHISATLQNAFDAVSYATCHIV